MERLRAVWRRFAPAGLRRAWARRARRRDGRPVRSYAYAGEDVILRRMLPHRGVFVDVGAHHPIRVSNTAYFSKRGWHGVNIDATPGSMRAFRLRRRRDHNVEVAVGQEPGTATFTTSDDSHTNRLDGEGNLTLEVQPLATILAKRLPDGPFDLLSIDVEGNEIDVIESHDWDRWRPRVVAVEVLVATLDEARDHPTTKAMEARGYVPVAFNGLTMILKDGI